MATQGIISIVKNGNVVFKCVAGCNGMTAKKTADALKELKNPTLEAIYDVCVANDFGCDECIAVQSASEIRTINGTEAGAGFYAKNFSDAKFNPRWECGLADYIEVVELNK